MISCTEFIPLYSELFRYLEELGGHEEVARHWEYISDGTISDSLGAHVSAKGIRGCWDYWSKSLNEEACDFRMELDEEAGTFLIDMRRCPSKGHLLEYPHVEPYWDYCGHCPALYDRVLAKYGIFPVAHDLSHTEEARCRLLYKTDKKIPGGAKLSMDRLASDNEYFHPTFHISKNRGLDYLGTRWGGEHVVRHLTRFARSFYGPLIGRIREEGLSAFREHIENTYAAEKAPEAVCCRLSEESESLHVTVSNCPGIRCIREKGYEVSPWYPEEIATVFRVIAEDAGYRFEMLRYDIQTGDCEYRVFR